jgi:hypothetical protein
VSGPRGVLCGTTSPTIVRLLRRIYLRFNTPGPTEDLTWLAWRSKEGRKAAAAAAARPGRYRARGRGERWRRVTVSQRQQMHSSRGHGRRTVQGQGRERRAGCRREHGGRTALPRLGSPGWQRRGVRGPDAGGRDSETSRASARVRGNGERSPWSTLSVVCELHSSSNGRQLDAGGRPSSDERRAWMMDGHAAKLF